MADIAAPIVALVLASLVVVVVVHDLLDALPENVVAAVVTAEMAVVAGAAEAKTFLIISLGYQRLLPCIEPKCITCCKICLG